MIILKKYAATFTMQDLNDPNMWDEPSGQPQKPEEKKVVPQPQVAPVPQQQAPKPAVPTPITPMAPSEPETEQQAEEAAPTVPAISAFHKSINDSFLKAVQMMGLQFGKKYQPNDVKIDPPDAIIEEMLNTKVDVLKGKKREETLREYLTPILRLVGLGGGIAETKTEHAPIPEQNYKAYVANKIKKFLTRERIRGWDFANYIIYRPLAAIDKPQWVTTLLTRTREVEQEGIPQHIQEMIPMPPSNILRSKPEMAGRIRAERASEAYRTKNWEYGTAPRDENGDFVRAGEKGSRTYSAIENFNRVYNILSKTNNEFWSPPPVPDRKLTYQVRPFGGSKDYGPKGRPYSFMEEVIQKAIADNEKTKGALQDSINRQLPPDQQISLDRASWTKGGPNYVNKEMVDPYKLSRDPQNFYKAMQYGGQTFSYDISAEGDEGEQINVFDPSEKATTGLESDIKERQKLLRVYDPLTLLENPLMRTDPTVDRPLKKVYTIPAVSRKVMKHMFDVPERAEDLHVYIPKKIQDLNSQIDHLMETEDLEQNPEADQAVTRMDKEIKQWQALQKRLPELDDKTASDLAKKISSFGSGITQETLEQVLYDLQLADIAPTRGVHVIEDFLNRNALENGIDPSYIKPLSENIYKVYNNLAAMRKQHIEPQRATEIKGEIQDIAQGLKAKYESQLAQPVSTDETNQFYGNTAKMEADVKLTILDFLQNQMKGAVQGTKIDEIILDQLKKRKELNTNYTKHELDTGDILLSQNNNLASQRLHHLVVELSSEILRELYKRGLAKGTLTAETLFNIRVALFVNKNILLKNG